MRPKIDVKIKKGQQNNAKKLKKAASGEYSCSENLKKQNILGLIPNSIYQISFQNSTKI